MGTPPTGVRVTIRHRAKKKPPDLKKPDGSQTIGKSADDFDNHTADYITLTPLLQMQDTTMRYHANGGRVGRLADVIFNRGLPIYTRSLAEACLTSGTVLAPVEQGRKPFLTKFPGPAVFLIGDDAETSLGPAGFHAASLRRAIRSCAAFSVIACEPLPVAYLPFPMIAKEAGRNVMLVECCSRTEGDWYNLIKKEAPDVSIFLATVKAEGRA